MSIRASPPGPFERRDNDVQEMQRTVLAVIVADFECDANKEQIYSGVAAAESRAVVEAAGAVAGKKSQKTKTEVCCR